MTTQPGQGQETGPNDTSGGAQLDEGQQAGGAAPGTEAQPDNRDFQVSAAAAEEQRQAAQGDAMGVSDPGAQAAQGAPVQQFSQPAPVQSATNESPSLPPSIDSAAAKAHAAITAVVDLLQGKDEATVAAEEANQGAAEGEEQQVMNAKVRGSKAAQVLEKVKAELEKFVPENIRQAAVKDARAFLHGIL